jgi:hypothetical protein
LIWHSPLRTRCFTRGTSRKTRKMAKGLPRIVKDNLDKCCSATVAAVDAYNRPGGRFRTAQFIVLIVIAWSALFHALFYRSRRRPWYRQKPTGTGRGIRYVRIDGDPKHWELAECLKQHFGDQHPPERKNLEFLLGLRNKIEHRHLPQLDPSLYGECQASLMNLESLLVDQFGTKYALSEQLAISLQFSSVQPEQQMKAAKVAVRAAAKTVTDYIERFRTNLPLATLNSTKYSFTVFLVPRVANRASAADAAVQFLRVDEASPEELERLTNLNVLIREKHIPIANLHRYKPGEVAAAVGAELPYEFNMAAHVRAWKCYGVRPPSGDGQPEKTISEYCVYDDVHEDYVYTKAWIDKLIRELSDPGKYQEVMGYAPILK